MGIFVSFPPPQGRQRRKKGGVKQWDGGIFCVSPTSHPQRMGEESGGEGEDGTRCIQDKKRSLLGTGLISGEGGRGGGDDTGGGGPFGHDNDCRTLATASHSAPRRRLPRPGGLSKLL